METQATTNDAYCKNEIEKNRRNSPQATVYPLCSVRIFNCEYALALK